jgi:hypothetical protein
VSDTIHLKFTESETVFRRIEIPVPGGPDGLFGKLAFDIPDTWTADEFREMLGQEQDALREEYLRTHQPPDWSAFASRVQARIDARGARV